MKINTQNTSSNIDVQLFTKISLIFFSAVLSITIIGFPISICILITLAILDIKNIRTIDNCEQLRNIVLLTEEKENTLLEKVQLENKKNMIISSPKMKELNSKDQKLRKIISEIDVLQNTIFQEDIDDISFDIDVDFKFQSSNEYKEELARIKTYETELKKSGAIDFTSTLTSDNSLKKGEKIQRDVGKELVNNFINEVNLIIKNNKKNCYSNSSINNLIHKIDMIFNELNKFNEQINIKLSNNILELEKEKFLYSVHYELKLIDEKEEERERREQEREEERAKKEIEKLRLKNEEEERKALSNLDEYRKKLDSALEEDKESIEKDIKKWENIVKQINMDKENIEEFARNYNVGFVYVISNTESFRDNILKIGMTRRPEPKKRFKELSNASVPFNFVPQLLIKSENAFKLEKELHNIFTKTRVNKVNKRKEFFYIDLEEIKKQLSIIDISYEEQDV